MKYLIFVLVLFGFVAAAQAGGNRCFNNAGYPAYGNNSNCCNNAAYPDALPPSLLYTPRCGEVNNVIPDNYFNRNYNCSETATPDYPGCGNIPSYGNVNNYYRPQSYFPSSHINSNCDSE